MIMVKRISTTKEFADIRQAWDNLLSESPANTVFLTWEWAFSWWEEFSSANNSLFILIIREHEKIIAIAPLVLTKKILFGFLNIKEINFLGTKTVHGEYIDFIISSQWSKKEVIESIFEYLYKHRSQWDIIRLTNIPEQSTNLQYLLDINRGNKYRLNMEFTDICPFIVLPDSWDDLHTSLKKSMIKNFKYQKRRLQNKFGAKIEIYDPRHLDFDIKAFFALHEKRWNSKGLPGAFLDQKKRRFYRSMAYRFAEKNWLGLWFLKIQNRPVAALWGFQYGNKFYYLQSGFDPEWSKYSIGQVLLGSVIEHAILEGCSEFDFLMGAEPYKYEWGAREKINIKLEISHIGIKSTILYALYSIKKLWE